MFIILSYDINQRRVGKVMKVCRKYLTHIHKSVFEGALTEAELKKLKNELDKIINVNEDSVCIYRMESLRYTQKEQIGFVRHFSNIIKKSRSIIWCFFDETENPVNSMFLRNVS